jgi:putative hydrolase of the HAD superfamily
MKNNAIKIVLWDYGGVLTESPIKNFQKFEKDNNYILNTIVKINSNNKYKNAWAKLEKDEISIKEFSILFKEEAKQFGIPNINTVKLLECLNVKLNIRMVELLENISKFYDCVCLTNNFKKVSSSDFESIKHNFSLIIESSKIGLRKPEKQIYTYILKILKVNAQEILFIDDLGINLKPARELGFQTYKFINTNKTISYMKNVLKI